jgi:hypothetical protein
MIGLRKDLRMTSVTVRNMIKVMAMPAMTLRNLLTPFIFMMNRSMKHPCLKVNDIQSARGRNGLHPFPSYVIS